MGTVYAITAVYEGNRQSLPVYATVDREVSGVGAVTVDASDEVEYYDLRGFRINSPAPGQIVIRRNGDKIEKIKL